MTVYRYTAVPLGEPNALRRGEVSGDSPHQVRARLRSAGLQVVRLQRHREASQWWPKANLRVVEPLRVCVRSHLRKRRRSIVTDVFDGLSTMLGAGMPLAEAVDVLTRSRRSAQCRAMLLSVRNELDEGARFADALSRQDAWFDPVEVAILRASETSGSMAPALKSLAARHGHQDALRQRVITALSYPVIVTLVGLGVVVFLSTHTLPDLVAILNSAEIATPRLTSIVIGFGELLLGWWPLLLPLGFAFIVVGPLVWAHLLRQEALIGSRLGRLVSQCSPQVLRRMQVGQFALQLAELTASGVPLVESLRVLEATITSRVLRTRIGAAARTIEQGDDLCAALGSDDSWFDAEFRSLLRIATEAGAIEAVLEQIGHRYVRQAERMLDRLAAAVEPVVILTLAALIGVVVMAAILPLVQLQEIIA